MIVIDRLETYKELLKPYYFYLAFENTRCKYYITEKFYNALASNVIPVAFGAEKSDYDAIGINQIIFFKPEALGLQSVHFSSSPLLHPC